MTKIKLAKFMPGAKHDLKAEIGCLKRPQHFTNPCIHTTLAFRENPQ